jgi:predicted transposase YdaD
MSKQYDRVFRKDMANLAMPVLKPLLGWDWTEAEALPDKLFASFDYETDFLFLLDKNDPERKRILHIEFQTHMSRKLHARMLTYFALLRQKHDCPVLQVVIFLKKRKKTAPKYFLRIEDQLDFSYHALHLHEIPFQTLLGMGIPEAFVVAILGDFGTMPPTEAIDHILSNIRRVCDNNSYLPYVQNLMVLSDLRQLSPILHQRLSLMPGIFQTLLKKAKTGENPIMRDILEEGRMEGHEKGLEEGHEKGLKEGHEKGLKKGLEKGRMEGLEEGIHQAIARLLKAGLLSVTEIAQVMQVPLETVLGVQKKLGL